MNTNRGALGGCLGGILPCFDKWTSKMLTSEKNRSPTSMRIINRKVLASLLPTPFDYLAQLHIDYRAHLLLLLFGKLEFVAMWLLCELWIMLCDGTYSLCLGTRTGGRTKKIYKISSFATTQFQIFKTLHSSWVIKPVARNASKMSQLINAIATGAMV